MRRETQAAPLIQVMKETPALKEVRVDIGEWIADDNNIALEEDGDIGAFEYEAPGLYTGHYFFRSARGRQAVDLARAMLHAMFCDYGAVAIQGFTPVDHKAALWMNRRLGFVDLGEVALSTGLHRKVGLMATHFLENANYRTPSLVL